MFIQKGVRDFRCVADLARAVYELKASETESAVSQLEEAVKLPLIISSPRKDKVELRVEAASVKTEDAEMEATEEDMEPELTALETKMADLLGTDLFDRANRIKNEMTCIVCLSEAVRVVFYPCTHFGRSKCRISSGLAMFIHSSCHNMAWRGTQYLIHS